MEYISRRNAKTKKIFELHDEVKKNIFIEAKVVENQEVIWVVMANGIMASTHNTKHEATLAREKLLLKIINKLTGLDV